MFNKLSSFIFSRINEKNFSEYIYQARVRAQWGNIVGLYYPGAESQTKAQSIQNGVLRVGVQNPIWITELEARREEIRGALIKKTAYPVKNIIFFVL